MPRANGYQVGREPLGADLSGRRGVFRGPPGARRRRSRPRKLVDDARRTAVQNAVQAWETLVAAKASADSTREQIRANQIALEGVEREAIVGSRTTLDVLNAQQTLLKSRTTLVQNLAQLVTASYQVAAAVGRLTARDLHLPVPLYDETAYYNAVKDKWVGLGRLRHRPTGPLSTRHGTATRRMQRIAHRRIGARGSRGGTAGDPSMEDILASIRRILSEDEVPAAAAGAPALPPVASGDRLLARPRCRRRTTTSWCWTPP